MEKTLVSVSVPNFITINLMAWVGVLLFILVWQFFKRRGSGATSDNSGG